MRGYVCSTIGLGVLEKYGLTAAGSCRGRGALICQTDQGLKVIREYRGSLEKLKVQREIQQQAEEDGTLKTDLPLLNLEGEAATLHTDGLLYTVRNWYDARECDIRSREEICRGAAALAHLHTVIRLPEGEGYAGYRKEALPDECGRHNREMRRVQHFLQKKQKKNEFERQLLKALGPFLEQGLAVTEELEASGYEELRKRALKERYVCHGECTQHNILSAGRHRYLLILSGGPAIFRRRISISLCERYWKSRTGIRSWGSGSRRRTTGYVRWIVRSVKI